MTTPTQIPSALKRKRAELEAQQTPPAPAPVAGDTVSPPAPSPTPTATPASLDESQFTVPTGQGTDSRLERAVEAAAADGPPTVDDDKGMQHKLRTMQGMLKARGQELETAKDQLVTVTRAMAELTKRLERIESTPPTPPQKPAAPVSLDGELTPEELQTFQKSLPTIQKIAAAAVRQAITPLVERIAQIESGTQAIRGEVETTRQMTYQERLRSEIPDLEEQMAEPEFELFLARPASQYDPSITVRDVLADAHRSQNVQTIKRVVAEYRKQNAPPPAVNADPALFQRPVGSSPQPVPSRPLAKPAMLAWSKRVAAGDQLRRGKISQTEFASIKALFDRAAAENRVDYNA